MAKRFTDTEIWEQDWYIDLPNKYKLLWNYIKDKCDNAGIWRPNKSLLQRIIGEPINLNEFLDFVNIDKPRIVVLPTQRWFLRDFFIFQYGDKFSPTSPVHKGAFKQLVANGIHPKEILGASIGKMQDYEIEQIREIAYLKDSNILSIALANPYERVKDKDKVKDKEKGGVGESFSDDGEFVIFADGAKQKLGKMQKIRLGYGELTPDEVVRGKSY